MAEEDHGPDQLIDPLPVGPDPEFQLVPLVGRLDPLASCRHPPHHTVAALPHPCHPNASARPSERPRHHTDLPRLRAICVREVVRRRASGASCSTAPARCWSRSWRAVWGLARAALVAAFVMGFTGPPSCYIPGATTRRPTSGVRYPSSRCSPGPCSSTPSRQRSSILHVRNAGWGATGAPPWMGHICIPPHVLPRTLPWSDEACAGNESIGHAETKRPFSWQTALLGK